MTPEQFAYWLQGFTELTQGQTPDPVQWKSICKHLGTVFNKVTPPVQTGPAPSVKDLGVDLSEVMRRFNEQQTNQQVWPGLPAFDWTKTTVTC